MANPVVGPVKRGDSFSLACTYKVNGTATSLAGITIKAEVRDSSNNLTELLTVTPDADQGSNPGQFLMASASQTPNWNVDRHVCDIQFTEGGSVRSSQTFDIIVEDDVTEG